MWKLLIFVFLVPTAQASKHFFEAFQNPSNGEFGLVDENNSPCLVLKFHARLYNFNLNSTDIATEMADFTLSDVRLAGFCALHNEVSKRAQIQADWSTSGRRKTLLFEFREAFVRSFGQGGVDELRWQLHRVVYIEKFSGKTIKFQTHNDSNVVSAPVRQKFLCKDRLNVTLHHPKFENIVVELLPEIDFQPFNTATNFGSNVYVCERTRRRTLSESFQSRMTVFSGVVLGLSSVGTLIGYSVHRQLKPERREIYNNMLS